MSNVFIAGYAGWPVYDTFHIVSLSGWSVYDPNPLRSNPNPKKPVSGSCRVRRLGQTLTPLPQTNIRLRFLVVGMTEWVTKNWNCVLLINRNEFCKFQKWGIKKGLRRYLVTVFFSLFYVSKINFLFLRLKNLFNNSKWTENKNCS